MSCGSLEYYKLIAYFLSGNSKEPVKQLDTSKEPCKRRSRKRKLEDEMNSTLETEGDGKKLSLRRNKRLKGNGTSEDCVETNDQVSLRIIFKCLVILAAIFCFSDVHINNFNSVSYVIFLTLTQKTGVKIQGQGPENLTKDSECKVAELQGLNGVQATESSVSTGMIS